MQSDGAINFVVADMTAKIAVGDFIDLPKEKARLEKDLEKINKDIHAMQRGCVEFVLWLALRHVSCPLSLILLMTLARYVRM